MTDERRRGGLGAALVLLVVVGAIAKFWVWIVVVLGVITVGAALIVLHARVEHHIRARKAVQAAIVARADKQHADIEYALAYGDDGRFARGYYGDYPPAAPPKPPTVADRRPRAGENWADYFAETRRKALAGDDRGVYGDYRPEVYPSG